MNSFVKMTSWKLCKIIILFSLGLMFSSSSTAQWQSLRANLYIVQHDTLLMADGILADYHSTFSNAVDYDDAPKMYNGNENVGLRRDGSILSIERRNTMGNTDTLYLNLSGLQVQPYRWIFSGINIAMPGRLAYLIDNFIGTTTLLNLAGSTSIDFSVTGNSASYAYNRFMIVFEQAGVVPVSLTSISASLNNNQSINVNWHVENEIAMEKYEVERSTDSRNFYMINKATPSVIASGNYQFIDVNPLSADNYYRVKATSLSGLVQYSAIVKVKPSEKGGQILVYPTLVKDKKLNISFNAVEKSKYFIQVSNFAGQVVFSNNVILNSNSMVKTIEMGAAQKGIYIVAIKNDHSIKSSYKIVVE